METFSNPNQASNFPFGQSPVQNNGPQKGKADRFLNFDIPTGDGGSIKLAYAALKMEDPNHKQLIEWLDQNPEANAKTLAENLVVTYRSAIKKERNIAFINPQ